MYKNIEKQTALELREQVDYQAGQIISRTLVQNELMSMTLFAFEKGEEISTHAAGGDAMVTVLEGTGRFTVGGQEFRVGINVDALALGLLKQEFPQIRQKLWKEYFWSRSFCLLTTGGAPIEVVRRYIENQGRR